MSGPRIGLEVAVIGAGVVGLAIAVRLANAGARVRILEQASTFGTGISERNSGVIHAGIYYDPASLKGRLCIRGKQLLYEHCATHSIRHRRVGKLFVALEREHLSRLEALAAGAERNGLRDLQTLDRAQVRRLEPALRVETGLLSPSTGLVDAQGLMASLLRLAEDAGAVLHTSTRVVHAQPEGEGWTLAVDSASGDHHVGLVVNAAGVDSIALARGVFGAARALPTLYPAPGTYWRLAGPLPTPLSRVVCPATAPGAPEEIVVAVPTLDGGLSFGPTSLEERAILDAVGAYLPDVLRPEALLVRGACGVRPRLFGPGMPPADFHIDWAPGVPPWLDLFGIESPGLTACLAIAELVEQRLVERAVG